jgi:hypothetical protein
MNMVLVTAFKKAGIFAFSSGSMNIDDVSHDDCPHCHQRFEIALVKFKLAGPQMISACPNCAMIQDNDPKRASWLREFWEREHLLLNRP